MVDDRGEGDGTSGTKQEGPGNGRRSTTSTTTGTTKTTKHQSGGGYEEEDGMKYKTCYPDAVLTYTHETCYSVPDTYLLFVILSLTYTCTCSKY